MKTVWMLLIGLCGLAAALWLGREAPWLRQAAQTLSGGTPQAGAMHKCLKGDQVLYTDARCPPGTRAQSVGGNLTVVPGVPQPPLASASADARPLLRRLDDGELKQRRMDAVLEP